MHTNVHSIHSATHELIGIAWKYLVSENNYCGMQDTFSRFDRTPDLWHTYRQTDRETDAGHSICSASIASCSKNWPNIRRKNVPLITELNIGKNEQIAMHGPHIKYSVTNFSWPRDTAFADRSLFVSTTQICRSDDQDNCSCFYYFALLACRKMAIFLLPVRNVLLPSFWATSSLNERSWNSRDLTLTTLRSNFGSIFTKHVQKQLFISLWSI